MSSVFISYRRDDSPDTVARIYQSLTTQLPNQKIFRDIDGIPFGKEFPDLLREKLAEATTILVIIGPRWLEILKQRQSAPVDHVRDEVRIALESPAKVIPVTVGGAKMPTDADLADFPGLLALTRRNGTPVRPDPDFDFNRLVKGLAQSAAGESVGSALGGKYKLLRKIGEGGMGTVFVAQQSHPVRRQVAVKLIKLGMDTKEVLARFDAEKQALAVMDHPNIAGVLDAGMTLLGRPFFVMELVQGKPITEFCDSKKLPPRERLELFKAVCHAVQHAHQKGIIHRDIKPSNVLVEVIDSRPVPKVIDFGLAKAMGQKLTDKTIYSESGLRIGTLEYMSPEQAEANHFDIDTRSDIYSLGVLLYELLTGNPPFTRQELEKIGDDKMRQTIRDVDPPIPSQRLSSSDALPSIAANRNLEPARLTKLVRGELDWIVMKTLEKDRTRRYETATGLARDVERYLADEVVEARPPSVRYRVRKFLRKHRGPVVAASLVLLALLVGIAGTTWGLIRAEDEADKARRREGDAQRAEAAAKKSEADAIAARNNLGVANKALEVSTDRLLSTAARSLLRPLAVQVRPDRPLPPLNDQEIEPLWELASLKEEPLRTRFVEVALQDAGSTRRLTDRADVALHAAVGLDASRRMEVEAMLTQRLHAMELPQEQREDVAICLAHLGILDPSLARKTAGTLTQITSKTDPYKLRSLSESLSAMAPRMEPNDVAQCVVTLTHAMTKTSNRYALWYLSDGLLALAPRMEPKEAALSAVTVIQVMGKAKESNTIKHMSECLSVVAPFMDPMKAPEAAATLIEIMSKRTEKVALWSQLEGLSAVAARMDPKDAAATFIQAITKTTDGFALLYLSRGLSAVAARMGTNEAAQVCGRAAARLTQVTSNTTNEDALRQLSKGLSAVAAHMDPKEAATALTQAMTKTMNKDILYTLSFYLAQVATRMEPNAVVTLTQAMTNTSDPRALEYLSKGVSAVAARMETNDAAQVCGQAAARLIQEMSKTTDKDASWPLLRGLWWLGDYMDPKEATVTLTQAMTKTTYSLDLETLSECLSKVATRMDPKEAAVTLTQAMTKTADPYALRALSKGLSAVAARMQPKDAAQACGQAAATLTQVMSKTTNCFYMTYLSYGLSVIATRMEPKEAARVCGLAVATITQAMTKVTNSYQSGELSEGLSFVAPYLYTKEAATILNQAISNEGAPHGLETLSKGLSAAALRMNPKEAAEACGHAATTLIQVMSKTTNAYHLECLSQGLSAVAAHMEPKAADRACGHAAATLIQVMSTTTDKFGWRHLSEGLLAVAARMEPTKADRVCGHAAATLIQVMSTTTGQEDLQYLSSGLLVVLFREEESATDRRPRSLMATVGAFASPAPLFAALPYAQSTLAPPPLPPQTLVDILKNPFCVGKARRLVLEQLTRHYNRPFADQWEFVDYVHTHKLDLDLTTPPERPSLVP